MLLTVLHIWHREPTARHLRPRLSVAAGENLNQVSFMIVEASIKCAVGTAFLVSLQMALCGRLSLFRKKKEKKNLT